MSNDDLGIRELYREKDWRCLTWERLFIQEWNGPVTPARAQRVCDEMVRLARGNQLGIASLIVLCKDSKAPDDDSKAVFAASAPRLNPSLRGVAYYTLFRGFKSAMVRSVLTALTRLARESFPTNVSDGRSDTSMWLARQLATTPASAPMLAVRIERVIDYVAATSVSIPTE